MNKLMFILCLFVLPATALAGGKLTVGGNYYKDEKDFKPVLGLAVYQPIVPGLVAYNGWTGTGGEYLKRDFEWAVTKHMIEFYINKVTLGAGVQLEYNRTDKKVVDSLAVKAEYKLW